MEEKDFKTIENKLLKTIHGNGLEILRFMNWLKNNYPNNQKMCTSCEKAIDINEGVFTCYECSQ